MTKRIKLRGEEDVKRILKVTEKYASSLTAIDAICGRYRVDACSLLGLMSLLGNEIILEAIGVDSAVIDSFYTEIEEMKLCI